MEEKDLNGKKRLLYWRGFQKTIVGEYLKTIVLAFVLVFGFIRPCVVEGFKIPSGSMENTLLVGDRIFVCKFIYGLKLPGTDMRILDFHKPARGDVFVFIPSHDSKHYIKRIVAVEGDSIETRENTLFVNGRAVEDSNYTKYQQDSPFRQPDFPPFREPQYVPNGEYFNEYKLPWKQFEVKFPEGKSFTVPQGYVFAMGDNRDFSRDSRSWGPVPVDAIKGQAFMVYWSYDALSQSKLWEIWKIPGNIRFHRIGKLIRSEFDGRSS